MEEQDNIYRISSLGEGSSVIVAQGGQTKERTPWKDNYYTEDAEAILSWIYSKIPGETARRLAALLLDPNHKKEFTPEPHIVISEGAGDQIGYHFVYGKCKVTEIFYYIDSSWVPCVVCDTHDHNGIQRDGVSICSKICEESYFGDVLADW